MFDIGGMELLLIGIVALIVVGPKDLPGMFRTLGRFTGKIRRMAREFQRAMEDAADESGVGDMAKDLKAATNPGKMGLDKLGEAAKSFDKWDPAASKPTASKAKDIGPETAKLSEERAEAARKIHEYSAKKTAEKRAAEAAAAEAATPDAPAADLAQSDAAPDVAPTDKPAT